VTRGIVAVAAAVLVAASFSGAAEQPPEPIRTEMPGPHFGVVTAGPFSMRSVARRVRPLGPRAPGWAKRLYRRSVRVLINLTDPRTGAMIAGEREGWDYVWPRDAGAGAIALAAAGLRPEAARVVSFLSDIDTERAARFYPDGSPVPGRPAAGDTEGWISAAEGAVSEQSGTVLHRGRLATQIRDEPLEWGDRQDYGENDTGDLLGNAIAAGVPASEIASRFETPRGLVRESGRDDLDSSAAWAVTLFPQRGVNAETRRTLLEFTGESTLYGIPPIEGWTPGQVWTAPTAWSAWALIELGNLRAADRLLSELRRAQTIQGTLPERVDATTGVPTSTTPLAWAHAFAILALQARYPAQFNPSG
jgi:glucoamylase